MAAPVTRVAHRGSPACRMEKGSWRGNAGDRWNSFWRGGIWVMRVAAEVLPSPCAQGEGLGVRVSGATKIFHQDRLSLPPAERARGQEWCAHAGPGFRISGRREGSPESHSLPRVATAPPARSPPSASRSPRSRPTVVKRTRDHLQVRHERPVFWCKAQQRVKGPGRDHRPWPISNASLRRLSPELHRIVIHNRYASCASGSTKFERDRSGRVGNIQG